ncbi:MAG: hypothetical protein HAW60_04420 [Bdellovibrionales bacterium]|nr:hypothetical protein [Bdellovibrionales bacterium]
MFKNISKLHKNLILLLSGLLGIIYFIPLWFIILKSPQYRDGLSMFVWLSKITGGNEFDLKNINLLNHYVGMKEVHAADFIEFTYMPYILGFMILGGIVTYFYSKRIMVLAGLVSFFLVALAGLYDLYRWEQEYGHNLDTSAALSMKGLSFSPPVLGCKPMMNFIVCSWPHAGGSLLLIVGFSLAIISYREFFKKCA